MLQYCECKGTTVLQLLQCVVAGMLTFIPSSYTFSHDAYTAKAADVIFNQTTRIYGCDCPDWITVDDITEEEGLECTVQYNDGERRSGVITINADVRYGDTDILEHFTFNVEQMAGTYVFEAEPEKIYSHLAQRVRINIKHIGVFWIGVNQYPEWATLVEENEDYFLFDIPTNESDENREGTFRFTGDGSDDMGVSCECTLIQEGVGRVYFRGGQTYSYYSGTGKTPFDADFEIGNAECTAENNWFTITDIEFSGTSGCVYYSFDENEYTQLRSGLMRLTVETVDGYERKDSASFYQNGAPYSEEFPIWSDKFVELSDENVDKIYYKITLDETDTEIYNGVCYLNPSTKSGRVRVNDVLASYLDNSINFNGSDIQDNKYIKSFRFYVSLDGYEYNIKVILRTYNDWSYEYHNSIISEPVLNVLDKRQIFLCSVFDTYENYYSNQIQVLFNPATRSPLIEDVNKTMKTAKIRNISSWNEITVRTADDEEMNYSIINRCDKRYCLYYCNLYGGWDSLVFDGKEIMKESYNIPTYTQTYDNNTVERAKIQYRKDITRTWELNTGYLNDEQSRRMRHVSSTVDAYLHDMINNTIVPVNITDTSYEERTWRNQGRKRYVYTVKMELAQNRKIQ